MLVLTLCYKQFPCCGLFRRLLKRANDSSKATKEIFYYLKRYNCGYIELQNSICQERDRFSRLVGGWCRRTAPRPFGIKNSNDLAWKTQSELYTTRRLWRLHHRFECRESKIDRQQDDAKNTLHALWLPWWTKAENASTNFGQIPQPFDRNRGKRHASKNETGQRNVQKTICIRRRRAPTPSSKTFYLRAKINET